MKIRIHFVFQFAILSPILNLIIFGFKFEISDCKYLRISNFNISCACINKICFMGDLGLNPDYYFWQ